eukprot:s722_g13.t1
MLQSDFFVPGSTTRREHERYRGKALFAEILSVTSSTTMTYFSRHLDTDLGTIMKSAEDFDWNRVSFILEAHGKSLEEFVEKHQGQSKNALRKSMEAAFAAWVEELRADQAQFCADKVLILGQMFNIS